MENFLEHEREQKARQLIEKGGEPPEKRKSEVIATIGKGRWSQMLHAVFSGPTPAEEINEEIPLPDGVHPDSIFRRAKVARRKLGNPAVGDVIDVTLAGNGCDRYMTIEEAGRLYSAMAFANRKGMIFNAHITIAWSLLGHTDHEEVSKQLLQFTKCLREWARNHGLNIAYVYAHECSRRLGIHTHLLVTVPSDALKILMKWVSFGLRGVAAVQVIPSAAAAVTCKRKPSLEAQWRWFSYLCKGIDPYKMVKQPSGARILVSKLIRFRFEYPGEVLCRKLVGVSSNVGPGSQNAANFQSAWQRKEFDIRSLYSSREYDKWQREEELRRSAMEIDRCVVGLQSLVQFL